MTYYDRFNFNTDPGTDPIKQRINALLDKIKQFTPDDLDNVPVPDGADGPVIELSWVKVPDPRPRLEEPREIEVLPILPVEPVSDDGGLSSELSVSNLMLMGKLPSGGEELLGYMFIPHEKFHLEPVLIVNMGEASRAYNVDWQSADAELWLTIAEAALEAQP
ncbi:MAG TPA: hypothetical protein VIH90_06450 [Candidatus Saccharimonadales bacterium]